MLGELKFEFSREEILTRVEENRAKHATDFQDAMEGWYVEVGDQFEEIAKKALAGVKAAEKQEDPTHTHFIVSAVKPESHLEDYDRIIDMLNLAKEDRIELDEEEFSQYVRDQWRWKKAFSESTAHYNSVKSR